MIKNPSIILASQSPRRQQLLRDVGFEFEVIVSHVEEVELDSAKETVIANALLKAAEIADKYPDKIVIGADTVVSLEDKILGKPHNKEEGRDMLLALSGKTHSVYTAVAILCRENGLKKEICEKCSVTFKEFDSDVADEYHGQCNPLDKAGAYNIDEGGEMIIETIEGEYENIMGLPVTALSEALRKIIKNKK